VKRNIANAFQFLSAVVVLAVPTWLPLQASMPRREDRTSDSPDVFTWQSRAKLHRGLKAATGTLILNDRGIEFRSVDMRASHVWPYIEVKTFTITSNRLLIIDYEDNGHHLPGGRRFRFEINTLVPASIAAELAQRVVKPAENGNPDPRSPADLTIPARHGTRFGSTNGTLRFLDEGIDYLTSGGRDSRSWRWADIQTLANPTPYQLRVGGYLETYEFDLKQPMSRELFERLWDHVYAQDLNVGHKSGGERHAE
jgi:hypothetical protein